MAESTLHPTQVEILEAIAARDCLSPIEFCSNGEEISRVAYHFRALKRAGLLEAAGSTQRRGATQHYYRLAGDARYGKRG